MLGGGGIKVAAKRTAFGDVSNTFNGTRPSKDDSTIPTKPGPALAANRVQPIHEKRSAAFLRPAQRPLSVSSLKGLLSGVSGVAPSDSTTRQIGTEVGPVGQPANVRRVLTKRNTTTIFKDQSLGTVHEAVAVQPPNHMTLSSTAVLAQAVPKPVPSLKPLTKAVAISTDPVKEHRKPSCETVECEVGEANLDAGAISSATEGADALQSDGIYIDEKGVLRVYEEHIADIQEVDRPVAIKATNQIQPASAKLETHEMGAAKPAVPAHIQQPVVSQSSQPIPSEPEEYWDEDEDDNYDDDGYVTARSYRSKGDNTTGGATTVLFPHVNQKVKREIAAAKELVEATRTAEEIEDECYDTSMVAEYGDEIFDYMKHLEVCSLVPTPGFTLLTIVIGQDVAKCSLHGQPTRDPMVYACCADGLACSSPPPIQPPSRDTVPLRQLCRPLPLLQGCLARQTAACGRNGYLHRCQIRGNQLPLCTRDGVHGRRWLHRGRDPEGRTIHAHHAAIRAWLARPNEFPATYQQGRRLRSRNKNPCQIFPRSHDHG